MKPFILANIIPKKATTTALLPYTGIELFGWWDPSDGSNVVKSNGRFDEVTDKSGNNNHLTGSGASRPFEGRLVNGMEVLDYQGAQTIRTPLFTGKTEYSYVFVFKYDTLDTSYIFDNASTPNVNTLVRINPNLRYSDGANSQQSVFANTNVNVITVVRDLTFIKVYINGIILVSGAITASTLDSLRPGSGGLPVGNLSFSVDGFFGEGLIYDQISIAQLNQTGQYLSDKYATTYTDIV